MKAGWKRGAGVTLCWWGVDGLPATAGPGTAGGSLPVTGMVTRKSKSMVNIHASLTVQRLVCIAACVGRYLG